MFECYDSSFPVKVGDKIVISEHKGGMRNAATGILRLRTVKRFDSFHIITVEGGGCPAPDICHKLITD